MPHIRSATPADLDEIWALVGRAVAHMNAMGNPQWGEDYPTRTHYEQDIQKGHLYAACGQDGAILGVAAINTEQSPEYADVAWTIPSPALCPHRMAVDPSAQRQGVGRSLFAYTEAMARELGLGVLHMDTYAQNDRMRSLVESLGFVQVGLVHFDREDRPLGFPCFEKVL